MSPNPEPISAVILAGGQARRLGGVEKGLLPTGAQCMLARIIARIQPQVDEILINANRALEQYQDFGLRIVSDPEPDLGPLAGIASGLGAAQHPLLFVSPCDCPQLPADLVARLYLAMQQQQRPLAIVHDGERLQPLIALIHRSLLASLQTDIDARRLKVHRWIETQSPAIAQFDDAAAFTNINTPQDLAALAGTTPSA